MQNEGWEIYFYGNFSFGYAVVDHSIAWDPEAPDLMFHADPNIGPTNDFLDPMLYEPGCLVEDEWRDFAPVDGSPARERGSDPDYFRGAVISEGFRGGECFVFGEGDCNANGVPDWIEILSELSLDENYNRIPDECER